MNSRNKRYFKVAKLNPFKGNQKGTGKFAFIKSNYGDVNDPYDNNKDKTIDTKHEAYVRQAKSAGFKHPGSKRNLNGNNKSGRRSFANMIQNALQ